MKVLLAYHHLYSAIGGGQTVMRNLIAANPDVIFYYFGDKDPSAPANAKALSISDHHRSMTHQIDTARIAVPESKFSLIGKEHDIGMMFDMAEAVLQATPNVDVIEIPDFEPLIGLFPTILRAQGVSIGKVVLGLHGTLTSSITDLWTGRTSANLDTLLAYEQLTYRSVDCRYGISQAYINKLRVREGIGGHRIDPLYAVNLTDITWGGQQPSTKPPSRLAKQQPRLNFVGRLDYIKGPDLFLYLASNLPKDSYESIHIYGSPVTNGDLSSTDVLSRIAKLRGLKINLHGSIPGKQLQEIYRNERAVTFITSRVDTFNLAALESLLNGCPTVISANCGICDYLDETWPDVPYIKVDVDNIWPSVPALIDLVTCYDEWRERIRQGLAKGPRKPQPSLTSLYGWASERDEAAAGIMADIAREISHHMSAHVQSHYLPAKINEVAMVAHAHSRGNSSSDLSWFFREAVATANTIRVMKNQRALDAFDIAHIHQTFQTLKQRAESSRAERIHAFELMAQAELVRGNDLLYVVYQSRCFRLSRRVDVSKLDKCLEILRSHNLHDDAAALQLLHRGSPDEIYDFLKAQPARCKGPAPTGIEFIEHFNRREKPRVAVLVSIYNAQDKVAQFVQGMRSFLPETIQELEVIFIDSGSPDQSSAALRRELGHVPATGPALDATLMRTVNRETIQAAWNRALSIVRAPYITFLGADEMMRPDSLKILAGILDQCPHIDWVQGNGVVCEVNEYGTPIKDVMVYNRQMDNGFMHYLDCCYMGWVGGLYRRNVHDRVGFYNPTFRAAGDNEFKNRALPQMCVLSIPEVLGTFRNFPEERTTQSPIAEIEDIRAWYLPRTVGGMRYAFEGRNTAEAVALFRRCFNYQKSYMDSSCTDIDLALAVAGYLELYEPGHFNEIQNMVPPLVKVSNAYRQLDSIMNFNSTTELVTLAKLGSLAKDAALQIAQADCEIRNFVHGCSFQIINDNRYHQHQSIWSSQQKAFQVDPMLSHGDMAGPQDLGELFSSCQSDDPYVDFESAWASGNTEQLKKLFDEKRLDIIIPVMEPGASVVAAVRGLTADLAKAGRSLSVAVGGTYPRDHIGENERLYATGDVASLRPVLAAAGLIALPYWQQSVTDSGLMLAVNMVMSGKPLLVSQSLLKSLTAALGDLGPARAAGHLLVAAGSADVAALALSFLDKSAEERMAVQAAARRFGRECRLNNKAIHSAKGELATGSESDPAAVLPLEWDVRIVQFGRALHSLVELNDSKEFGQLLSIATAGGQDWPTLLHEMARHVLITKTAPALQTSQAVFQRLRAMEHTELMNRLGPDNLLLHQKQIVATAS